MIFLKELDLIANEYWDITEFLKIYNSYYPYQIFEPMGLSHMDLSDISIFYGDNGTGKTTLLNIIARLTGAIKKSRDNYGDLFDKYVSNCSFTMINKEKMVETKMLTSDDVFDRLLDVRAINAGVNRRKEYLADEYMKNKYEGSYADLDEMQDVIDARRMTKSAYIRSRLRNNNFRQQSNGESALDFWQQEIRENGLYLLDEPENSLSPMNQIRLKEFIEESVRFFGCQFIISTHSPFLLALQEARIFDLDNGGNVTRWEDLESIRNYYQFFKDREDRFE